MSRQGHQRVVRKQVRYEPSPQPYEFYGQPEQHYAGEEYHYQEPVRTDFPRDVSQCSSCNTRPVYGAPGYGRVVLNNSTGACFRPNLPSGGQCHQGPNRPCPNLSSIPSYGHSGSYNSGAQFVMESAH